MVQTPKCKFFQIANIKVKVEDELYRGLWSTLFNSSQKMALRAFHEVQRSQRHLLAAFENNWLGAPIERYLEYSHSTLKSIE